MSKVFDLWNEVGGAFGPSGREDAVRETIAGIAGAYIDDVTTDALGNLICPNNTVAACATVDQIGNESNVMKKTLKAFAVILVMYMVLAMLYTCVLFPTFGM